MDGVRRPEAFQAVIGGQVDSAVAAERHFSPAKVHCKCLTDKMYCFLALAYDHKFQSFEGKQGFATLLLRGEDYQTIDSLLPSAAWNV